MSNNYLTKFFDELVEANLMEVRVGDNGENEYRSTDALLCILKDEKLRAELEDKYFNERVDAGDAKCEDCGEWDTASNCDYDDDTGLHTNCGSCRTSPQRVFESDSDYAYRMSLNKK